MLQQKWHATREWIKEIKLFQPHVCAVSSKYPATTISVREIETFQRRTSDYSYLKCLLLIPSNVNSAPVASKVIFCYAKPSMLWKVCAQDVQ